MPGIVQHRIKGERPAPKVGEILDLGMGHSGKVTEVSYRAPTDQDIEQWRGHLQPEDWLEVIVLEPIREARS